MRPTTLLLTAPLLGGCLTATQVNSTVERRSSGLETLADAEGVHLAIEELAISDGVVELGISTAGRELEAERFDLAQNSALRREWKQGGKAGRNLMWIASAAASWVGAFGVSWESADGQRVQIGGLGGDAQSWQGVLALVAAASGVGVGAQQTLAVRKDEQIVSTLVGAERILRESRSLPEAPFAGHQLDLAGTGFSGLQAVTDTEGRVSVPAFQLSNSAWSSGLDLYSSDGGLAGRWQPSEELRTDLLKLPANWDAPFHASLLDNVSILARQVEEGGVNTDLPLADLSSPEGVRAAVEPLTPEEQAPQVQAWLVELEPLAQEAAAQRARIHLDVLRADFEMTESLAPAAAAAVLSAPGGDPELLNPLFQPMELFRGLPQDVLVTPEELRGQRVKLPGATPRVVLLEAGACSVSAPAGVWSDLRVTLRCDVDKDEEATVLISTVHALGLYNAKGWVVAGLLANPTELEAGTYRSGWLPTVTPLYAASLGKTEDGQIAFTQVLDEALLVDSGVLLELGR
jgi:hypothetical protein